jgi:CRISPR-associated endonuclease/helicase Cas3
MCPAHRLQVLESMRKQLPGTSPSRPLICVSTQLIEAGVDVDFASVVRDLAGLDSIVQAAGRCNRNGALTQPGRVHVIALPEPGRGLEAIVAGREVTRELLTEWRRAQPGQAFPLDDPQQMQRYYQRAFFRRKNEMSYPVAAKLVGRDTTLLELLGGNRITRDETQNTRNDFYSSRTILLQSFKTAAEAFHVIAQTQGVVAPYGEKGALIVSELAAADDLDKQWRLLRAAQQYTISLYPQQFQRMLDAGVIYPVGMDARVYCLLPQHYDPRYGVHEEAGGMEDLYA